MSRASLEVVGAGSFTEAAILQVAPWADARAMRRRLIRGVGALADVRRQGERPATEGGFAPHISAAYYPPALVAHDVAGALEPLRHQGGRAFEIDAVSLVSVRFRTPTTFDWDVVERFVLG
jgi:hypothetical protein